MTRKTNKYLKKTVLFFSLVFILSTSVTILCDLSCRVDVNGQSLPLNLVSSLSYYLDLLNMCVRSFYGLTESELQSQVSTDDLCHHQWVQCTFGSFTAAHLIHQWICGTFIITYLNYSPFTYFSQQKSQNYSLLQLLKYIFSPFSVYKK